MPRNSLYCAVVTALATFLPGMGHAADVPPVTARQATALPPPAGGVPPGRLEDVAQCSATACTDDGELLFELRTRAFEHPRSGADASQTDAGVLQPDRRVEIGLQQPGKASVRAMQVIDLPAGGVVWASEDPALGQRALGVSVPGVVAFRDGAFEAPLPIQVRSNYPTFITRQELMLFRASDVDLVRPLARIDVPVGAVTRTEWQGPLDTAGGLPLRQGESLLYVLRVYDADGRFDQTTAQSLMLVSPEEARQNQRILREGMERSLGTPLSDAQAQEQSLTAAAFNDSGLRYQNIPLYGSRVRLHGQDIAPGQMLSINGASYPVDMDRKFAAEFLVPVGQHSFQVQVGSDAQATTHTLEVDVSGRYAFGVGLADVSIAGNRISGSTALMDSVDGGMDESRRRGRLAFYGKARMGGRYLFTAHADTTEQELDRVFSGLTDSRPDDIFRRLDPDLYYPVYGDDSTTWRDVDTQGRLYLRMDWDHSTALWGNYNATLTGTELAQYNRALYGAALDWRSLRATRWGEAGTTLKGFAAQPDTVQGRSEFVGTGGSLYYLRHTDILPGSDVVTVQVRDRTTGRIVGQDFLQRGADYEIDELQGRVILSVPLAQITRRAVPTLTRDTPLDGYEQTLQVDYAWVPGLMADDATTFGLRAHHWIGDHLGVGVTRVEEGRAQQDYQLEAADITLKAGQGTWLRAEVARTESFGVPIYWSANGGLDFQLRNSLDTRRKGEARSVEGRINLQELGWTDSAWSAAAWWREREAGYSSGLYDSPADVEEAGVELSGQLGQAWQLYLRASRAEAGQEAIEQAQATLTWLRNARSSASLELRRVDEQGATYPGASSDGVGTLLAARWLQQLGAASQIYVQAQKTLDDDEGRYADNDAVSVGGQWVVADRLTVDADATHGKRGDGYTASAEYRLAAGHSFYGGYTYSTDSVTSSLLRPNRRDNGWTLGQRWRLGTQTQVFSESQMLEQGREAGLVHTFGLDYMPGPGWRSGLTLSDGELEDGRGGLIDRQAVSVHVGRTDQRTDWSSKLEWRRDTGAERREQWVSTHRLLHKFNEDWRVALRLNWADTQDALNPYADARFVEANAGLSWRPWNNQRWAMLARYTYLHDLATLGQVGGAEVDQESHVVSMEGIHKANQRWEYALKLARREGRVRMERGQGPWLDSATTFAAVQARYDLQHAWHALAEYRWLDVDNGGTRTGVLLALERDVGRNLRLGAGYNFTDFSDDLTNFDYRQRGWFLSLTGVY